MITQHDYTWQTWLLYNLLPDDVTGADFEDTVRSVKEKEDSELNAWEIYPTNLVLIANNIYDATYASYECTILHY